MAEFYIKNVSSLEKILPDYNLVAAEYNSASCLKGEKFSYQMAFFGIDVHGNMRADIEVISDLADKIELYDVVNVPVCMPAYSDEFDPGFITRESAVLPDVLTPCEGTVCVPQNYYKAVWVKVNVDEDTPAGVYDIKIKFKGIADDKPEAESVFTLEVIDAVLPKQKLMFTQWFHCDCISSYYDVEPLSEKHWELIEDFLKMAADNGINMLLTPIFTPPLDTQIGAERPTVQLVDVKYDGKTYTFGFEKLDRWIKMCKKYGIEYLEISHLFTQWGALCAPKIEVEQDGKLIKKFGWQTDSLGDEYKEFISQLMPVLTKYLEENWDKSKVYFHISDEPSENHIERYGKIHDFFAPFIEGFHHMDALSEYEIYEKGFVETPVPTIRTIESFVDHKVEPLWAYYCCGEGKYNLCNRFIAMPSYRNRITGTQLYKYDAKGFLQWGYNFYYSQYSTRLVNPYINNDADGGFPAGDAFSVYPGQKGALPALRLFVFNEGLQDMRAMEYLEELTSREYVLDLIKEYAGGKEITFRDYPFNPEYILKLRSAVNEKIKELKK